MTDMKWKRLSFCGPRWSWSEILAVGAMAADKQLPGSGWDCGGPSSITFLFHATELNEDPVCLDNRYVPFSLGSLHIVWPVPSQCASDSPTQAQTFTMGSSWLVKVESGAGSQWAVVPVVHRTGPEDDWEQLIQYQWVTYAHSFSPITHSTSSFHTSPSHTHTHTHYSPLCTKMDGMLPNHRCCSTCESFAFFTTHFSSSSSSSSSLRVTVPPRWWLPRCLRAVG